MSGIRIIFGFLKSHRNLTENLLITFLLIPLFWININGYHDWGGDFAQYIHHAKNLASGLPYSQTGYIYNPDNVMIGPQNYPVGFPLLLTPIVLIFGNNIVAFQIFITLIFITFLILLFNLLRQRTRFFAALLIVIVLGYNHLLLGFKDEVMADLPFVAIFTAILLLLTRKSKQPLFHNILLMSFVILAMITKEAAIFLIPVFFIVVVASFFKISIRNAGLIQSNRLVFQIAAFLMIIITPLIINYLTTGSLLNQGYLNMLKPDHLGQLMLKNLIYYYEVFLWMFSPFDSLIKFQMLTPSLILLLLIISGLIRKIIINFCIVDLFFLSYLAMILLYPYVGSGFRFLIPILPIMAIYILEILKVFQRLPKKISTFFLFVILGFVIYSYQKPTSDIIVNQHFVPEGPQHPASLELFDHIKNKTSEKSVIMFFKPRVMALYTNRNSIGIIRPDDQEFITNIKKYSVDYVVKNKTEGNSISEDLINFELDFENELFAVYKIDY